MYRDINSDLVRGNIDTIILKALGNGEKYGVEIAAIVEASCNSQYIIKQPTLYSCLNRLEKQGLTESYWKNSDFGGRRRYYNLTETGKQKLKEYKEEWAYSRTVLDHLITNDAVNIDLYEKKKSEILQNEAELALSKIAKDAVAESKSESLSAKNDAQDNTFAPLDKQLEQAQQSLNELDQIRNLRQSIAANSPALTGKITPPSSGGISFAGVQSSLSRIDSNPYLKVYGTFNLADEDSKQSDLFAEANPMGEEVEMTAEEIINYKNILGDVYKEITDKKQVDFSAVDGEIEEETLKDGSAAMLSKNDIYENTSLVTEKIEQAQPTTQRETTTDFSKFLQLYNRPVSQQQVAPQIPQPQQTNIQIVKAQKLAQVSNTKYVQYSKLKFFQSIIVALFMVIVSLTAYYLISSRYPINNPSKSVYILCVLLAAWFVVLRGIFYFVNPYDKKEISFNAKSMIFVKILAMILTLALVFSANVFMGFTTLNDVEFYSSLILPSILTLTYPLSSLILFLLVKSNRFSS